MTTEYRPMSPVEYTKRKRTIFRTSKSYHEFERRMAELEADYRRPDPATIKPPFDPRPLRARQVIFLVAGARVGERKPRTSRLNASPRRCARLRAA